MELHGVGGLPKCSHFNKRLIIMDCPKCGKKKVAKKPDGTRACRRCGPMQTFRFAPNLELTMPHPNQFALPIAVDAWIDEANTLPDRDAADRLQAKVNLLQDKIHLFSIASYRDVEPCESVAGLSVVDLMAAQSRLAVEATVRRRMMRVAA